MTNTSKKNVLETLKIVALARFSYVFSNPGPPFLWIYIYQLSFSSSNSLSPPYKKPLSYALNGMHFYYIR